MKYYLMLTKWSRILLEKLIVAQIFKKFLTGGTEENNANMLVEFLHGFIQAFAEYHSGLCNFFTI